MSPQTPDWAQLAQQAGLQSGEVQPAPPDWAAAAKAAGLQPYAGEPRVDWQAAAKTAGLQPYTGDAKVDWQGLAKASGLQPMADATPAGATRNIPQNLPGGAASVPGGYLPGVSALPAELQRNPAPVPITPNPPISYRNPRTGIAYDAQGRMIKPEGNTWPGAEMIGQGIVSMAEPAEAALADIGRTQLAGMGHPQPGQPATTTALFKQGAQAASDIVGGAMEATAPIAIPAGLVTAPVATVLGVVKAMAAGTASEYALKKMGVPDEYANFAGTMATALVGGIDAKKILDKIDEATGHVRIKLGRFEEDKPLRDLTDEELIAHASALKADPPKNYAFQKDQIVQEVLRRTAARGMQQPPAPGLGAGDTNTPAGDTNTPAGETNTPPGEPPAPPAATPTAAAAAPETPAPAAPPKFSVGEEYTSPAGAVAKINYVSPDGTRIRFDLNQPGVGGTLKLDMPVGKFQQVMGLTPAAEEQKEEVPEPPAQTTGDTPDDTQSTARPYGEGSAPAPEPLLDQPAQNAPEQSSDISPDDTQSTAPTPERPITYIPTSSIKSDPARFQFKSDVGQGGVGQELKDVQVWDPLKGGVVGVWQDPADGETYIVDGHHRLDLANRLGVPELAAMHIKAATATEARGLGALSNISTGRGTSIDAAKIMRDLSMTPADLVKRGVSLTGAVAKQGLALANLPSDLFERVWQGDMRPARGAVLGEMLPGRFEDQRAALAIADKKRLTDDELREMVRLQVAGSPVAVKADSQWNLFGEDDKKEVSTIGEKAEISEYIQQELSREKRLFNAVGDEGKAATLTAAGNDIKAAQNKEIALRAAQTAEVYQKLSATAGPVHDILNSAALELANGGNSNAIKQRAYADVRTSIGAFLKHPEGKDAGRVSADDENGSSGPGAEPGNGVGESAETAPEVAPPAGQVLPAGGADATPAATTPETPPPPSTAPKLIAIRGKSDDTYRLRAHIARIKGARWIKAEKVWVAPDTPENRAAVAKISNKLRAEEYPAKGAAAPAATPAPAAAAQQVTLRQGDRVSWTGRNGEPLTGTVRSDHYPQYDDSVSVDVDQIMHAGGVPIGRIEQVKADRLTKIPAPEPSPHDFTVGQHVIVHTPDDDRERPGVITMLDLRRFPNAIRDGIRVKFDDDNTERTVHWERVKPNPAFSPSSRVIHTETNENDRMQAIVAEIPQGFSVAVRDMDSGNYTGVVTIYKTKEQALAKAKEIHGQPAPGVSIIHDHDIITFGNHPATTQRGSVEAHRPDGMLEVRVPAAGEPAGTFVRHGILVNPKDVRSVNGQPYQHPEPSTQNPAPAETGLPALAQAVYEKLKSGGALGDVTQFNKLAEEKLGASRTSGQWSPKDAFDAMEAGINKYLLERAPHLMAMPFADAMEELRNLMKRITSQGVRTDDQIAAQQFSTPPTEAFLAVKAANPQRGETGLEPSAGNAGIAVLLRGAGVDVHVNEIAQRRLDMLRWLGFDPTNVDGEVINALLPAGVQPSVIVMNPPFSSKVLASHEAKNRNQYGFNHVDQALQRLAPGGRLVTILGGGRDNFPNEGASFTNSTAANWFEQLARQYNIRANVRISGKEYQKYGTNFATRIIVIDKDGPTPSRQAGAPNWDSVVQGNVATIEQAYNLLRDVADSRPAIRSGPASQASAGEGIAGAGLGANTGSTPGSAGQSPAGSPGNGEESGIPVQGGDGRPADQNGSPQEAPGGGHQPTDLLQPGSGPQGHLPPNAPAGAPGPGQNGDVERPLGNKPASLEELRAAAKAAAKKALEEQLRPPAPAPAPTPAPAPAPAPEPARDFIRKVVRDPVNGSFHVVFVPIPAPEPAPPPAPGPPKKNNHPPPPPPPPPPSPQDALAAAAEAALQAMRDRRARRNNEPGLRAAIPGAPEGSLPIGGGGAELAQDLSDLTTIAAAQMVVHGRTEFPAWRDALMEQVGDLIGDMAQAMNQPVDAIIRMLHQDAAEVAASFNVIVPAYLDPAEQQLDLERDEDRSKAEKEDSGAYVSYKPTIKGPPHPGDIVETKTMSTVPLPELTVMPNLPDSVIAEKRLSAVQLEAIAIGLQQNGIIMSGGFRGAALIGDGTGVGKGRIGAGYMWSNYRSGHKRIVFISEKWDLMGDPKHPTREGMTRDLTGIGATDLAKTIKPWNSFGYDDDLKHDGIIFGTYGMLRAKNKRGVTRKGQLQKYLRGDDNGEHGVIIFDESHNLKNAVVSQGGQASQVGIAARELMLAIPALRSLSLSATAATDVSNLGYLDRLGLWGPGTPFPNGFQQFAAEIGRNGLSAMELVARELKAQGKYISRTLSLKGVTYKQVPHELTPEQREIYRTATRAWGSVIESIEHTILHVTNGGGRQRGRALANLYAAQLRFYGVLLTALKTPTAIAETNKALAEGKAVIITLVNTNEAAQEREKTRVNADAAQDDEDEPLDYDFGPKNMLIDMVRENYPIQQWVDDVDAAGNPIKRPLTTIDDQGNEVPVENPEAKRLRDELIAQIDRDLHLPGNPLDILIDALGGSSKVAELTGRKERFDNDTQKFVKRAGQGVSQKMVNLNEMANFQSGKKLVALMSNAAGTGITMSADLGVANQRIRYQFILQPGWSADKVQQMLGRSHRSNQKQPPEYAMIVSDMAGEKRFSSTIARRLGSLGALTTGQSDAASGKDLMGVNIETEQGEQAADSFYGALLRGEQAPGVALGGRQILREMHVLKTDPNRGDFVPQADRRNVPKMMNRLMGLDPDYQTPVFNYFYDMLQAAIDNAIEHGTLDTGVKTLPGDTFNVKEERAISKDPATNALTLYYPVDAQVRNHRLSAEDLDKRLANGVTANARIMRGEKGNLLLVRDAPPSVHADGSVAPASHTASPGNGVWRKVENTTLSKYTDFSEWAADQLTEAQREVEGIESNIRRMQSEVDRQNSGGIRYGSGKTYYEERLESLQSELPDAQRKLAEAQTLAADSAAIARQQWAEAYEAAPSHTTIEHHLIGGTVLRWWNAIRDVAGNRLNIYTAVDSQSKQRVVGIEIPRNQIGRLLARITGNRGRVTAAQVADDVMRNGTPYQLESGVRVVRGRVARVSVVQVMPPNDDVARNLVRLGALHERGVTPIYYIPNQQQIRGTAPDEGVLGRILEAYPVREEAADEPASLSSRIMPGFFSQLERTLEAKMPAKSNVRQIMGILNNPQNGVTRPEPNPETKQFNPEDIDRWVRASRSDLDEMEGMPVLYVNAPAMDVILRARSQVASGETSANTGGTALTRTGIQHLLEEANFARKQMAAGKGMAYDEALVSIAKNIEFAMKHPDFPGALPIAQHNQDIPLAKTARWMREEVDHAKQYKLAEQQIRKFLPPSFLNHPLALKAAEALSRYGYAALSKDGPFAENNNAVMVMEIGVRLMRPGLYRELGLTRDEAIELARYYIRTLGETHGERARQIIEQTRAAFAAETSGPGRLGSEHPEGPEPETGTGVRRVSGEPVSEGDGQLPYFKLNPQSSPTERHNFLRRYRQMSDAQKAEFRQGALEQFKSAGLTPTPFWLSRPRRRQHQIDKAIGLRERAQQLRAPDQDRLFARKPAPSTQHPAPGLFDTDAERQARIEKEQNDARLLHDQLTAQINSGMAARPAKIKPAQNRNLFEEEGPEQGGLFSREENQPGTLKPNTAEKGSIPASILTAPAKAAESFVRQDVIPAARAAAQGMLAGRDNLQRMLAPASREGAKSGALILRHRAAELAQETDRAARALEGARAYFDKRSIADNHEFIDRMETGRHQASPAEDTIAMVLRTFLDQRRDAIQALGTGKLESYYENYFPHIWKNPAKAAQAIASIFAKRPLEGPKSFLKKRTIITVADGLAKGLELASDNPIDLVLAKLREMDKYLMAHKALNDLKAEGSLHFVRAGEHLPEGYAYINDPVATVFGPRMGAVGLPPGANVEPGDVRVYGQRIMGKYAAPEPVATLVNNYLSPGLRDKSPLFRAYLGVGNMLNQVQLGLSAYHLTFTTLDAMTSKLALGLYQAGHGDLLKGLGSIAALPASPFTNMMRGSKMLKEWYEPGTQGAEIAQLVDAMMKAGGRARMDSFYRTNVSKNMMTALRKGNVLGAALRLPFSVIEQAAKPIMEWLVPRQKMGVFADMARYELSRLGQTATPAEVQAALAKAWDSVDNRMGQLVYDNLFWNKVGKDLAMGSVRSVGWNLGTIRELGGGATDFARQIAGAAGGKLPEMTHRTAYLIALPLMVGAIGAIMMYLWRGHGPESLKDYFFPRDAQGKRWAIASYMKDVYNYGTAPFETVKGKVHPLAAMIYDMLSNKDFFDAPIRNPNDPLVKQLEEEAHFLETEIEPLGVRMIEARKHGPRLTSKEKVLPFVGITPAPKRVDHPQHFRKSAYQ